LNRAIQTLKASAVLLSGFFVVHASYAQGAMRGCNLAYLKDQGSIVLGKNVKFVPTEKNKKKWMFFLWRGSQEQERFFCPWGSKQCTYKWEREKTVASSFAWGFDASVSMDTGRANKSQLRAFLEATYSFQRGTERSSSVWFGLQQIIQPGYYVEPMVAQNRGWEVGNWWGGYRYDGLKTFTRYSYYCYNWDGMMRDRYSNWNNELGSPFRYFHITRN
jgi:hypothetical protein